MAFIGNTNTTQSFTPAIDYFSGNGSTTAFTLSRPVASVAQVQVTIDNVAQNPSSAYTVSANTITFTSAPLSGTNNIYVRYTSPITQVIAPGQGTVNTTALGNITNIASGNSSLTLQTGSGNTTAVTIDTSQNVGIGTSSPTASANYKSLTISGTSGAEIYLNAGATNYGYMYVDSGGFRIINPQSGSSSGTLQFYTSNTERMRIDSSGNVGIGTTSPTATLHVRSATDVNLRFYASSGQFVISGENNAGSANIPVSIGSTVFYVQSVYNNTTASAANVNVASNGGLARSTSALKYKQDIRDLESIDITKFRPVRYKSKCETDDQTKDHFGIIADEVDEVGIKELVSYGAEGEVEGFQYERLTVVLLKSIQELKAINDQQAETINALTARIEALENR